MDKHLEGKRGVQKAFFTASIVWLMVGLPLILAIRDGEIRRNLFWFVAIWVWCNLDLIALGKTVARLMALVSSRTPAEKGRITREAIFWAFLKLVWLGSAVFLLGFLKELPLSPVFLGFGSLVVIPILGGWLSVRWTSPFDDDEPTDQGSNDTTSF